MFDTCLSNFASWKTLPLHAYTFKQTGRFQGSETYI